jgi:D-alanine-D-alanine ligase
MKILLLAGGDSNEREVSLNSSRAIYESLVRQGHTALVIDPADGRSLLDEDGRFIDVSPQGKGGQADPPAVIDSLALTDALHSQDVRDVEVVFIGLHGGAGENGSLQNLLELAGLKYTGSDMMSSAIAMNKAIAKRLMASENILTPKWFLYRLIDWKDRRAMARVFCRDSNSR